jgi:hypothetical protein
VQTISPPPGIETQTVQSVAYRYTDYSIPARKGREYLENLDVGGGMEMVKVKNPCAGLDRP